jgi:hypothetical protein
MLAAKQMRGAARASARMMSTVANLLDSATANYPLKEGLRVIDQDIRWNYSDLKKQSEALACGLLELGVEPGSTIAVSLPNNAENVVAHFAAAKAGFVVAGPDAADSSDVFIFDPDTSGASSAGISITTGMDRLEGSHRFKDILVYGADPNPLDSIDVAASTPFKQEGGSVLTHGDVVKAGKAFVDSLSLTSGDRVCAKTADSATLVGAVSALSTVVIPGSDVDQTAQVENCTHVV